MHASLDAFRALVRCETPEALTQAVDAITAKFGVDHWFYGVDLPLVNDRHAHFHLGGYPEGWLAHYVAQDYLRIDPVIAHCHDHATPYLWSEVQQRIALSNTPRDNQIRRFFEEAASFGLVGGVSIPLHGPGALWGVVSYSCQTRNVPMLERHIAELHLLAHYLHETGRRFATARTQPAASPLTPRERECLYWASEGKTSWEIGKLLHVTERTVVFHLQNAASKLGVTGRQAAVARAISLGLIDPA